MKEIAQKEKNRVEFALSELKKKHDKAEPVLELIYSYSKDAGHFFEKGEFLEAFELYVYVFGLLDALARLDLIDTGNAKMHYKI